MRMAVNAYHLRTDEPAADALTGLETGFTLHSLFIPSEGILLGFSVDGKGYGTIRNYSSPEYCERAQAIVDGNRGGVKGKVIGKIKLSDKIIERLYGGVRHVNFRICLEKGFDESTKSLVNILRMG